MNAAVQTSALERPEPEMDLFGPAPTQPAAILIELKGTLLRNAEVREKPVGDGYHALPVLCLELVTNAALHQTLHVEQVYTENTRHLAAEKAASLKRGAKVSITTNLLDMRVSFPHVERIQVLP